ncbi:MAG TPA: alpha/beta fold hydrolase [Flavisolibacter sp.]|nr:alpha/beta fold hydrolase [Flavisolibacter sp.]
MMKGLFFLIGFFSLFVNAQTGRQRFAVLGDYKVENGGIIKNCRIGYRSFGKINSDSTNIILVCTWFSGRSEGVSSVFCDKDGFIDTTIFHVIVVDGLGNGISSSPSHYREKGVGAFPFISIADMVHTQHQLLTKHLRIKHLYAVAGISMGGMQVFQWMVSFPDFMDKAISINGTPRQSSYDKLLWNTELSALEVVKKCKPCLPQALQTVAMIHELHLYTPAYRIKQTSAEQYENFVKKEVRYSANFHYLDWIAQLRAMISHDVVKDKSWAALKERIKAKALVIVALQDIMVNPSTSIEFARQLSLPLIELQAICGHQSPGSCDKEYVKKEIRQFLNQ